jgi:ribosomal small subunit protein bTHX
MGKGDKKTKRGKIFASSYGNSRPKPQKLTKIKKEAGKSFDDNKKQEENE